MKNEFAIRLFLISCIGLILLFPCKAVTFKDSSLAYVYKHKQPRQFVLKTNPLALLWGCVPYMSEFRMVGEMTNGLRQSGQIGISLLAKSPFLTIIEGASRNGSQLSFDASGIRIQGSYKFYFKKYTAPVGWYFSPHASFAYATITERINMNTLTYNATRFNVNLLLGHQYIRRNGFALDWFFGFGRKSDSWSASAKAVYTPLRDINYFGKKINFVLGISIGYSF